MKTAAIIEARMTSTRLQGKILRPILNRPMLELLIERLGRARTLDQIVVATTDNRTDDVVEDLTKRLGIGCFRGSEDDVLDRVLNAASTYHVDTIVEITGDCPLIDPEIVDRLVQIYQNNTYDYVSNVLKRTFPRGLDVQVFGIAVLGEVARLTQDPVDHEHVSLYIHEHPERFRLYNLESDIPQTYWDLRLTVDTVEDFTLINSIYEELYPVNPAFVTKDILRLLEKRKDLSDINRHIKQKKAR